MAEIQLDAEIRNEFGKGASRRLRRAGKVPAVLYGHGTDPVHVSLPSHATLLALREANALLNLNIDGRNQLALPKQVQRDPIRGSVEHVDLIIVRQGEKVTVDVPLHVIGEAADDTSVNQDVTSISLLVLATNIPQSIVVDLAGLEAGSMVLARDLVLPEGATLAGDEDELILGIVTAQELSLESAEAESESGDEAAAEAE